MKSYSEIKKWFFKNKEKLVVAASLVVIFIIGFGSGRFVRKDGSEPNPTQSYYTTKSVDKPTKQQTGEDEGVTSVGGIGRTTGAPAASITPTPIAATSPNQACTVKGSPSSKIYHVKGDQWYSRLKNYVCFASNAEAEAAGYTKAKR